MVLRTAINASGLSLDRIQYRLRLRDSHVSVPTLSNWQSGRRQPERPESRRAVAELEQVLGLAAGTLVALLEPPKPRGTPLGPVAAAWGSAGARLLSTMDTTADARLLRLSQHDTVTVAANGLVTRVRTRHVFRARQDGAVGWIDVWHHGADDQPVTTTEHWHCRVGRTGVDRRARLAAAELALDAPLSRDATAIAEYEIEFPVGPHGRFFRRFPQPVREYVLEIRFDPAAPPVRCRRGNAGKTLTPSRSGSVHLVGLDVTGLVDVTWQM
jgi:hypothetical protein